VQERLLDWSARFGALGLHCLEMTGDTETTSWADLADVDIMCVSVLVFTPDLRVHHLLFCTLAALTRRYRAPRRSLTTPGAQRRPHLRLICARMLTQPFDAPPDAQRSSTPSRGATRTKAPCPSSRTLGCSLSTRCTS
jgi:hypothetical protein